MMSNVAGRQVLSAAIYMTFPAWGNHNEIHTCRQGSTRTTRSIRPMVIDARIGRLVRWDDANWYVTHFKPDPTRLMKLSRATWPTCHAIVGHIVGKCAPT